MLIKATLLVSISVMMSGPAYSRDPKPVDSSKRMCRDAHVTGSRMPRSTCHTNAEWKEIDARNAVDAPPISPRFEPLAQPH
jgi:hypothetical protein